MANLRKKGVKCDFLSSVKTAQERSSILQDVKSACPSLRLLYITPELLSTEGFMGTLKAMNSKGTLTLFAVDEAHCISSWCVKRFNQHSILSLWKCSICQPLRKTQAQVLCAQFICRRKPCLMSGSYSVPPAGLTLSTGCQGCM